MTMADIRSVAHRGHEGGVRDPVVMAAAPLHDTVEDTKTTPEELSGAFGAHVAAVVEEVDGCEVSVQARAQGPAGRSGRTGLSLASPPKDWSIERKRQYFDWSKKVIDQVRGTNPKLERRFDQLFRQRP